MLHQRVRPRAPAGILPPPASLPNLRAALQRRADVFGPYDGDEIPDAPRGPAQALGTLARRVVVALDIRRRA